MELTKKSCEKTLISGCRPFPGQPIPFDFVLWTRQKTACAAGVTPFSQTEQFSVSPMKRISIGSCGRGSIFLV